MVNEGRILFWILVVGVLLYLYTEQQIRKLKDEMEFQLFVYERVLKDIMQQSRSNNSISPASKPQRMPDPKLTYQGWQGNHTAESANDDDDFLDKILPTKEDLLEATIRGEHAVQWAPENAQQSLPGVSAYSLDCTTNGAGGLGYAEINF
jgi:hypothetical protein